MMNRARFRSVVVVVAALLLIASSVASADPATPAQSAAAQARTISATGVGQVSTVALPQATMLNISVHQQANGDPKAAIQAVEDKVAAVRAALEKAGVPEASIQVNNFNLYPVYGPPPGLKPEFPLRNLSPFRAITWMRTFKPRPPARISWWLPCKPSLQPGQAP